MRVSSSQPTRASSHGNGTWRLLHWLVVAIVTLQLAGSGFHRHDLTEGQQDCVSCYLVAHVPSPLPPVSLDALPARIISHALIARVPLYPFIAQPSYLPPHGQAPPARFGLAP